MTKEQIRLLLQHVRPYFRERLGKFTHKRVSDDWYFHALGFVRDDMTYVFGFNLGFFGNNLQGGYTHVGMSITVRANGLSPEIRSLYLDFFGRELASWAHQPYTRYHSDRGGEGLLITRYAAVDEISEEQIIEFLKRTIDDFRQIYPRIVAHPHVFDSVMRAGMPWDEPIVSLAREFMP